MITYQGCLGLQSLNIVYKYEVLRILSMQRIFPLLLSAYSAFILCFE